jgi:predicted Zn finger-like uncharacterized protein
MTVACPFCHTKYSLNENVVKSAQQKMRCSKCGQVFIHPVIEAESGDRAPEQAAAHPSFAEIAAQVGIGEDVQEEVPGQREEAATKPRIGLKATIIVLFILILLCAAGYFYWMNYMGAGDRWLRIGRLEGQEVVVQDGRVFLATGLVSNGSTKGRKTIVLRVKLFDREGKIIKEKDSLAGMLLSKQQIPAMQKSDIEKRIAAFKLAPAETFRVEAGKEIPFSISFFDHDFGKAKEFTVEIIKSSYL